MTKRELLYVRLYKKPQPQAYSLSFLYLTIISKVSQIVLAFLYLAGSRIMYHTILYLFGLKAFLHIVRVSVTPSRVSHHTLFDWS